MPNKDITVWFLSQRVLPPVATVVPFYLIMRALGLLDTYTALILLNATFVLPFVVVIVRQTFLDLPVELEEAALVDGAGHWGAFWRIALPLAAPSIAATGLIIFAFTWNEFLFALTISIPPGDHRSGPHRRRHRHPRRAVLVHGRPRHDRHPAARRHGAPRPALYRPRPHDGCGERVAAMARPGATLPGKAAAVWPAPRARRTYAVPASLEPLRYALVSALAVAVALVFLFPIYWSASNSLRDPLDTFTVTGLGFPWLNFHPTLKNWIEQATTPETVHALENSTVIALGAAALALCLGTPAAYALARFRFRLMANRDITVWFLSQRVLPPVASVVPFYLIMRAVGLLDTRTALILLNATFILPFVVVIVRQTFLDLPVELEESGPRRRGQPLGRLLAYRPAPRRPLDRRHRPDPVRLHLERVHLRPHDRLPRGPHRPGPHHRRHRRPRRPVLVHGRARHHRHPAPGRDRAARPTLHRPRPDAGRGEGLNSRSSRPGATGPPRGVYVVG